MEALRTQTILDAIVDEKRNTLLQAKQKASLCELKHKIADAPAPRDFAAALAETGVRLIAEIKRASPSKGLLREDLTPACFAKKYMANGAACISVLTDAHFQGLLCDLRVVSHAVNIPVLRKDFVFDPYQIYEARANGADAVLLITAILSTDDLRELYDLTTGLGMTPLVEVHNKEELDRVLMVNPAVIGINNRDLKTFRVDLDTTAQLSALVPEHTLVIAESGIYTREHVAQLRDLKVDAMLVGESIVTSEDVAGKVSQLAAWGLA